MRAKVVIRPDAAKHVDEATVVAFDAPTIIALALRARHRLSTRERAAIAVALRDLPAPHADAGSLVADFLVRPLP